MAWNKGSVVDALKLHSWIGVDFLAADDHTQVLLRVPPKFAADLAKSLAQLASGTGSIPIAVAEQIVGRAGRVAHIVPKAHPFVAALYTALTSAKRANEAGRREAHTWQ